MDAVYSYLLLGTKITLQVSLLSGFFATLIGCTVGLLSLSHFTAVQIFVRLYIDIFRGIPSLITLLFVFFILPTVGITTTPIIASILGLALWGGANIAENARGALISVPQKQVEAARALGMSKSLSIRYVLIPQAITRFLPSYIGQLTVLIQGSTLTSVVGVTDLLGSATHMIERLSYISNDLHAVKIYSIVLVIYFVICYPLTVLSEYMEKRLKLN